MFIPKATAVFNAGDSRLTGDLKRLNGKMPTVQSPIADNLDELRNIARIAASRTQKNVSEGDTPSFLELINNGLDAWENYGYGGWGGRFQVRGNHWWVDAPDDGSTTRALTRWTSAIQNDFAARLNWCVANEFGNANHAPVAVLNGDRTKDIVQLRAKPGDIVTLSSADSRDPDGNAITSTWMIYREAGTFGGDAQLAPLDGTSTSLSIPATAHDSPSPRTLHVILTIEDNGTPPLVNYRRAIITVSDQR